VRHFKVEFTPAETRIISNAACVAGVSSLDFVRNITLNSAKSIVKPRRRTKLRAKV
jgi:uncharacterized protein (DUF1778 family)